MKKSKCVCLFIAICVAFLLFASYGMKKGGSDINNIFFDEYIIDDTKTLENSITRVYDLNELTTFFKGNNANENIGFGTSVSTLSFSNVNCSYPIEVLRSGGYSVYKVREGGYFYVFWVTPFSYNEKNSNSEPTVYFSSYLSSDKSIEMFDSIIIGRSTAKDVSKIDPAFELSFLNSSGIFSYSYINDDTILQIQYSYQGSIEGYDDLIVENKKLVARDSVPSRYSVILSIDTPMSREKIIEERFYD